MPVTLDFAIQVRATLRTGGGAVLSSGCSTGVPANFARLAANPGGSFDKSGAIRTGRTRVTGSERAGAVGGDWRWLVDNGGMSAWPTTLAKVAKASGVSGPPLDGAVLKTVAKSSA